MKRMYDEKEIVKKLYQHVVYISDDYENLQVYFVIISPKSFAINSLTDLKTYLGNTFSYQVTGLDFGGPSNIYQMNEEKLIGLDGEYNWSLFTMWNDKVLSL